MLQMRPGNTLPHQSSSKQYMGANDYLLLIRTLGLQAGNSNKITAFLKPKFTEIKFKGNQDEYRLTAVGSNGKRWCRGQTRFEVLLPLSGPAP